MKTYNVQVTQDELDILTKGIELWQSEPQRSDTMGAIFGAVLGPRQGSPGYEDYKTQSDRMRREAEEASQKRKLSALRLQLKLQEALSNPKEFSTTD